MAGIPSDDDEVEEEEVLREIARMKIQKRKAAQRAALRQNELVSQSPRTPLAAPPSNLENSDGRRGQTQDYYSPPSVRGDQAPPSRSLRDRITSSIGDGRPAQTGLEVVLSPVNAEASIPLNGNHSTAPKDEHYKYYQGQRLSSTVFSPGYGFRSPVLGNDPLPSPQELVGPYGTVHRIYPAPSPICAPLNANTGWADDDQPSSRNVTNRDSANDSRSSIAPSESAAPGDGAIVPWTGGVQYENADVNETDDVVNNAPPPSAMVPWTGGVVYSQANLNEETPALSIDELLACFPNRRERDNGAPNSARNGYGGYGGGDGRRETFAAPRQDSGWTRPAQSGERQGWADRGGNKNDNNNAGGEDEWGASDVTADHGNNTNGDSRGSGGGGGANSSWNDQDGAGDYGGRVTGEGCYKCGKPGHYSRECPNAGGGGGNACFNCGQSGHMSRECPEPRKPGGGGNCYNCEQPGHQSKDCPEPKKYGTFRGACHNCGETGHRSSECRGNGNFNGFDNNNNGEGTWSTQNGNQGESGRNGSWDNDGNSQGNNDKNDDDWGNRASAPVPAPSRASSAIHPSRLAQVDTRPAHERPVEQPRGGFEPPNDGRPRDSGWGARGGSTTPAPRREPTPMIEDNSETGGW
ncbi:uncharacterized protein L201_005425 [Kwoniella dendrophila CBS 6074]|uniref:CCHC-type domain-containing protein n=1 Tax=Kwoniella dendrophila CBS 6074 TaxID=1295534 RepID=A0AAX4K035_9TREE